MYWVHIPKGIIAYYNTSFIFVSVAVVCSGYDNCLLTKIIAALWGIGLGDMFKFSSWPLSPPFSATIMKELVAKKSPIWDYFG